MIEKVAKGNNNINDTIFCIIFFLSDDDTWKIV